MYKILAILLSIFLMSSCSNTEKNEQHELFSYSYDYQFYGIDNSSCNLKASTVSTLKGAIDIKETTVFLISTPTCLSCKNFTKLVNEIAIDKQLYVYNIDPYSSFYPVYETSDFDILLNIVKDANIKDESEFVLPILLIINNGIIDDYIVGYDTNLTNVLLKEQIEKTIEKSILIK